MSNWNQKLWGIKMTTGPERKGPILLGVSWWVMLREIRYQGEPSNCLLFKRRKDAREARQELHKLYHEAHDWNFNVVPIQCSIVEIVVDKRKSRSKIKA